MSLVAVLAMASSDHRVNLLRWARRRAEAKGIPFAITVNDIYIPTYCPILGIKLKRGKGRHSGASPSLDRIDPSRGYEPGNVIVISRRANVIKSDSTLAELALLVAFLQQLQL